jgi:hypothetical protein
MTVLQVLKCDFLAADWDWFAFAVGNGSGTKVFIGLT